MKDLLLKMQPVRFPRWLWQCTLETVWVLGTGTMVGRWAC